MVDQETKDALKLRKCKVKVREIGESPDYKVTIVTCGREYLGQVCPDDQYHLYKFRTGFCINGWHEGDKAVDWKGAPVPTCTHYMKCPCSCHGELDRLFEITGRERILVESSGYEPPHRTWWMPSDDPLPALSTVNGAPVTELLESPDPTRIPATLRPAFKPTPTGRAARGELELWVKEWCDIWLVDESTSPCTPAWLSEKIARDKAIDPPSIGAISAVFVRWEKLGFAVFKKKPTRFVGYTQEGIELGLDKLKARVKRIRKQTQSNLRRGIR